MLLDISPSLTGIVISGFALCWVASALGDGIRTIISYIQSPDGR